MSATNSHRVDSVDTNKSSSIRRDEAAYTSLPLVDRLESIFFCDPIAQNAAIVLAVLAGPPILAMEASLEPFSHAMCVDVLGPAFTLVMLGLVLVLDFRNWAREKVSREAAALNPDLSVSLSMQLSSESLQLSYHRWISGIPAVKWTPWLAALGQIGVHIQFAKKSDTGCNGWLPQSLLAVITIAAAGYLGGREVWGFPPAVQSSIGLAIVTYGGILMTVMSAAGNLCFLNLFGDWTLGTGEATLLAAIFHSFMYGIFGYIMAMVDMVHLHLLTAAVLLTTTTSMYLQFLYHRGGISLSSDPGLWGLLVTFLGTTFACQLASVMRYYIAQANMTNFLRSIPR